MIEDEALSQADDSLSSPATHQARKRWRAYLTTASAVALASSGATGTIIHRDFSGSPLTATSSGFGLDFDNDAVDDFTFGFRTANGGIDFVFYANHSVVAAGTMARRLSFGYAISAGRPFHSNSAFVHGIAFGQPFGNFANNRGYLGVRFQLGGQTRYGWVDYEGSLSPREATIHGIAYEDSGAGIFAGATSGGPPPPLGVPEPTTTALTGLALLAVGAAGLRRHRKLRSLTS